MSRTYRKNQKEERQERHISVRSVRRDPPDLRKLSRAVIALALAEMEAEAQADAQNAAKPKPHDSGMPDTTDTPELGGRS